MKLLSFFFARQHASKKKAPKFKLNPKHKLHKLDNWKVAHVFMRQVGIRVRDFEPAGKLHTRAYTHISAYCFKGRVKHTDYKNGEWLEGLFARNENYDQSDYTLLFSVHSNACIYVCRSCWSPRGLNSQHVQLRTKVAGENTEINPLAKFLTIIKTFYLILLIFLTNSVFVNV